MGLDTCICRMWKPDDASRLWTDDEVIEALKDAPEFEIKNVKPVKGNEDFKIEGADGYLFKCTMHMFDPRKMRKALGIRKKDGWEESGCCSDPCYTPKDKCPDPETVEAWFQFTNRHHSWNCKDWEFKEIPSIIGDDSLIKLEDWWCIATIGDDLADMRKGENEKLHEDGQWDDNFCPICSKRILAEHMIKYFDEGPGYTYDNCREAFKEIIFDKFEDRKGLCVTYS